MVGLHRFRDEFRLDDISLIGVSSRTSTSHIISGRTRAQLAFKTAFWDFQSKNLSQCSVNDNSLPSVICRKTSRRSSNARPTSNSLARRIASSG
jgi:hypothetical protein